MGERKKKEKKSSGGSCGRAQTKVRGSITPFDEKTSGLLGVFRRPVLGSSEPRGPLYLYQKHCLHAPTLDGGSIVARCCSMTAHGGFKVALGETKSQVRGSMAAFEKKVQQKCLSLCVAISMGFSCSKVFLAWRPSP